MYPCEGEGPDEHERNCHINREFDPIRGVNDMIIVQSKTLYSGFRLLLLRSQIRSTHPSKINSFVSPLDRLLISQSATEVIAKYIKRDTLPKTKTSAP